MGKPQIILAEPNTLQGKLLTFRLENEGYSVTLCRNGAALKTACTSATPEIIIMNDLIDLKTSDLELPINNSEKGNIPLIVIESFHTLKSNDKTENHLAHARILSPVSPAELIAQIEALLNKNEFFLAVQK